MAEPMSTMSPVKLNSVSHAALSEDNLDMSWHEPPSSPFLSYIETDDQENIAPTDAPTPFKPLLLDFEDDVPQSAFKMSPEKKPGLKERTSPSKMSPSKQLLDDFDDASLSGSINDHGSPKKSSPVKPIATSRPESAMSDRSRKTCSPSKTSRTASVESTRRPPDPLHDTTPELLPTPSTRPSSSHSQKASALRENEGLTVAMSIMKETHETHTERSTTYHTQKETPDLDDMGIEDTEFNPDGPDFTVDDTCFSDFSEMPAMDMLRKSPTKNGLFDQATPRARAQMTPSTVRHRAERTPSPTPRRTHKENDTTNLLLDFTAQFEAFSTSRRGSPSRGRTSPTKSSTEPNLLAYMKNQRSPAKGGSTFVPSTPSQSRQLLNLLDFELPPPPTPRSVPTVTIRELESLKSNFQSQLSSLSASLSGKEAEVESLVRAVSDAERRVGETQETLRDERSAREHAEAQMVDWKNKGEEVQRLLQDVQAELARNDAEREQLLARLGETEKRAEEADNRASDLETKIIEAENKFVDMTTFVNPDEGDENRKIYSEAECQSAIAEKVNEVARDLHAAYKAKHEKKIKALKDNYQKKADERCKELRVQIIRLERQVEDAEKKRDDTFSKVVPTEFKKPDGGPASSSADDLKALEAQKSEIENLKAKIAGLQSELQSLHASQDRLLQDLETERVEKGELVAAAEQMLAMCGEKMGELQQEELRMSTRGGGLPSAPQQPQSLSQSHPQPEHVMRNTTGFFASGGGGNAGANGLASSLSSRPGSALGRPGSAMSDRLGALNNDKSNGSGMAKPSGLRAPGGFGFGGSGGSGGAAGGPPGLTRSQSSKSRLMSNIERMGGGGRGGSAGGGAGAE
ncbi:hypothetical protein BDV95DRAFT_672328 [Massariosphaeria phaeospora]|uniref:Uncharacterized protein n=1 Tax=Massariosphaeria phaeospora TaxID=100035 RepID=A0A7C8MFR0_9PLEO|nr:hypothetical protein BDV95DRAFT_672328 [Massariosphaeria phaeospora]